MRAILRTTIRVIDNSDNTKVAQRCGGPTVASAGRMPRLGSQLCLACESKDQLRGINGEGVQYPELQYDGTDMPIAVDGAGNMAATMAPVQPQYLEEYLVAVPPVPQSGRRVLEGRACRRLPSYQYHPVSDPRHACPCRQTAVRRLCQIGGRPRPRPDHIVPRPAGAQLYGPPYGAPAILNHPIIYAITFQC